MKILELLQGFFEKNGIKTPRELYSKRRENDIVAVDEPIFIEVNWLYNASSVESWFDNSGAIK